jgi:predicted ATPase
MAMARPGQKAEQTAQKRLTVVPPHGAFVGRESVVRDVASRIRSGDRVVTLTGPPGIGKSRIAWDVGATLGPEFAAGAARCDLADAVGSDAVLEAVERAVGTPRGAGMQGEAAAADVARKLGALGPLLLILDDVDAVLSGAVALVEACIEAGAPCAFVVTSREALAIAAERLVFVGPLSAEASFALFQEQEQAAGASWPVADVAAWLEWIEGHPLAVELSARRMRTQSPRELLARGDGAFDLIRSNQRDRPERHRSLAAAVAWSFDRLTADEQRALVGLAMFEGPVPLEAFEAVVGPDLEGDPIDLAHSLLGRSLATSVPGAGRLAMPRVVRSFALRQGSEGRAESAEGFRARHAAFFLGRAEALAGRSYGANAVDALDALRGDTPNLLAAFDRARASAPAHAARIAIAMADVAIVQGAVDLRAPVFSQARDAADASGDDRLRAGTRIALGRALLEIGRPADAAVTLADAVDGADAAGLADAAADARRSLAWAKLALGRADEGEALLEHALARYADRPSVRGQADALAARGLARCLRGVVAEGKRDLESAHALHVVSDDRIRRDKVAEMAAVVGLTLEPEMAPGEAVHRDAEAARLRESARAHHAAGRLWREAIDLFRLAAIEASDDARQEDRARARAAATAGGIGAAVTTALATASRETEERAGPPDAWAVGEGARWVQAPGGARIDLARHGSMRLVLDALVARRLAEPGAATSAIALLEKAWPGERVRHESGMLRVYTAIRRLRAMGLADVLETRDDGYLLSARVAVERRDT